MPRWGEAGLVICSPRKLISRCGVRAGLAICSLGNVVNCGTRPYFIVGGVRRVWQYAP
ncbi:MULTISPECIES: hypothetical protein [Oscillatoriales]|uniref:hypothetical protein n=1 Tax=Limnospira platensis TaxID=118562 RepID=UPI0001D0EE2A|nr:hypothetical protein NIES39_O03240 [Arthrospira platensis NIES-39]